jgi:hypothetical protein
MGFSTCPNTIPPPPTTSKDVRRARPGAVTAECLPRGRCDAGRAPVRGCPGAAHHAR